MLTMNGPIAALPYLRRHNAIAWNTPSVLRAWVLSVSGALSLVSIASTIRAVRSATLHSSQSSIAEALADHATMHLGVLAHIERDQVKAESIDASQQALHGEQSGVLALVVREAVGDQLDVGAKLRDFFIRKNVVVVGGLQALLDQPQETPGTACHDAAPARRDRRC